MQDSKLISWHNFYFDWIIKYKDIIDWNQLSKNKNISMEIIENNPDLPWNYWFVSQNPNINKEFIIKHQDKHLYWNNLAQNIKLDQQLINLFYKNLKTIIPLCKNQSLTIKNICSNIIPWNYNFLAKYFNINENTIKIFLSNPYLSHNKNLTPEMINNYPNVKWNFYVISENPNIDEKFVRDNLDKDWNWYFLSNNMNISLRFILENSDKKNINWKKISARKDLTYEILIEYQELPWYWQIISKSNNQVPFKFIEYLNQELISKWFYFQSLADYTIEDVEFLNTNLHYYESISKNDIADFNSLKNIRTEHLDFYYLSQNKKLTFDWIDKNINQRWDFAHLSNHDFDYQKELFYKNLKL